MKPIAAIDIGSNTLHLLVGVPEPDGGVKHLDSASDLLELGQEVERHGRIRDKKLAELRRLLRRYVKAGHKAGAKQVLIAGTRALREATNGTQAALHLSRETGLQVHVLSSRAEARLTLLGAEPDLDAAATQVLIDSGGASTEVTLVQSRKPAAGTSIPVGASLLCDKLKGDPPEPLEWACLMLAFGDALKSLPPAPRPASAIAVGGSAHRIEELHGRGGGKPLRLEDLEAVARRLLRHRSRQIARATGLPKEKVTLVAAGSLILYSILGHYNLDKVQVSHRSLRDGMILAHQKAHGNWWRYS